MFKKAFLCSAIIMSIGANDSFSNNLPSDEYLAELYAYSCNACHGSQYSGAPLAGDKKAWQPRLAKGMDKLLDNTINGYRAMPALGSCSDCTAEDFESLIKFMAGVNDSP